MDLTCTFILSNAIMEAIESESLLHERLLGTVAGLPFGHGGIRSWPVETAFDGVAGDHTEVLGKCGSCLVAFGFSEVVSVNIEHVRVVRGKTANVRCETTRSGNHLEGAIGELKVHARSPVCRMVLSNGTTGAVGTQKVINCRIKPKSCRSVSRCLSCFVWVEIRSLGYSLDAPNMT